MTLTIKNLTEIPASVIARTVRKELKEAFPGIKFTVSGKRDAAYYIEGGEIIVEWTDGPTADKVDVIIKKHIGIAVDFDPYTDYWTAECIDNGDGTYNAVSSAYTRRNASEELLGSIVNKMMAIAGVGTPEELNAILVDDNGSVVGPVYHHFRRPDSNNISLKYSPDLGVVSQWAFHQHDAETLKALVA